MQTRKNQIVITKETATNLKDNRIFLLPTALHVNAIEFINNATITQPHTG